MLLNDRLDSALWIKAYLLEYLLKKNKQQLFGNEIFYGANLRAADIISIGRCVTAFEVKSSQDNLDRLKIQLDDYKKVFDYLYIVTTPKHFSDVKKMTSPNIGLFLLEKGSIQMIRKAKLLKKSSKIEILK